MCSHSSQDHQWPHICQDHPHPIYIPEAFNCYHHTSLHDLSSSWRFSLDLLFSPQAVLKGRLQTPRDSQDHFPGGQNYPYTILRYDLPLQPCWRLYPWHKSSSSYNFDMNQCGGTILYKQYLYSSQSQTHSLKKKKKEIPILHKNVLDEAAEVVNVITSLPLCLLNNLNNEMGSTHKALL